MTELDALLDRVREDRADRTGKNRNAVVYDCWRMFEDLATRYKEECAMRDLYNSQSQHWFNEAHRQAQILAEVVGNIANLKQASEAVVQYADESRKRKDLENRYVSHDLIESLRAALKQAFPWQRETQLHRVETEYGGAVYTDDKPLIED